MGRAKKHKRNTVSPERHPTDEKYVTTHYAPPEAKLSRNKARTRKYDIWSMGCVMFESLCWLLYGLEDKDALESKTTSETLQGTRYWVPDPSLRTEPAAKINDTTASAMTWILDKDPECMGTSALRDLLLFIRDHVLVIIPSSDPTNPFLGTRVRTDAETMRKKLAQIILRADQDPEYLWTRSDRTDVKAPLLVAARGGSNTSKIASPRNRNSYSYAERDIWEFQDDETFARSIILSVAADVDHLLPEDESPLCEGCRGFDFQSHTFKFDRLLGDLEQQKGCGLCALLLAIALRAGVSRDRAAQFIASESTIQLQWGPTPLSLSLHQNSGKRIDRYSEETFSDHMSKLNKCIEYAWGFPVYSRQTAHLGSP